MAEQEQATDKHLAISKIYIKDFSFESPQAPLVFKSGEWNPKTNLNLRSAPTAVDDNIHEVVLTITVEAKEEDKTLIPRRAATGRAVRSRRLWRRRAGGDSLAASARTFCSRTRARQLRRLSRKAASRSSSCSRSTSMRCTCRRSKSSRKRLAPHQRRHTNR